jgi:hypothetical protein
MSEHSEEERTRRDMAADEGRDSDADAMQFGDRESERDVSYDDIRNRAHEIYLGRGGSEGDPIADWLEAEREVRARSGAKRSRDDLTETDQRF